MASASSHCAVAVALGLKRRDFTVVSKLRNVKKYEYPWPDNPNPNVKGGVLSHLSYFKPLKEKQKPVTLDFEKPLLELEKKIIDVRKMAEETGMDFSDQIITLETKYQQALEDLHTHLTPAQRSSIARHPNRPTFLDHVFNITEKFVELHGDRAGYDDPAIVTGLGTIDGRRYMFIGHQKGRNTKENIHRNFGMPTPHGYRKALRMFHYADHHGFPIITFLDTPGAYPDLKSEELGQGEAIAQNVRTMFGLKVPIVSIVIGEGGSGGALAIGCANKLLMLENAVFYVASPEACAAILWKSAKASPKATEKLKFTASDLCKLQIIDGVIPEPLGGAHADPSWASQQIKVAINEAMDELIQMKTEELLKHRMLKYRKIGEFQEGIPIDPKRKINMKKRELSKTKFVSNRDKRATMLKEEFTATFEDVIKNPNIKQKYESLKAEVEGSDVSSASDLDVELKRKMKEFKEELVLQLVHALRSKGLDVDVAKAKPRGSMGIEELNSDIKKRIEIALSSSSDLKSKIEQLKIEVGKVGNSPDLASKSKICGLELQIKQIKKSLVEAIDSSSGLKEKHENLMSRVSRKGELSAASNGSLKKMKK